MNSFLLFAVVSAVIAIVYGLFLASLILKKSAGNERMQEIAKAIQEGATAYLNKQYKTIGTIAVILFFIIGVIICEIPLFALIGYIMFSIVQTDLKCFLDVMIFISGFMISFNALKNLDEIKIKK